MVKKIVLALTAIPFIAAAGTNDPSMDLLIQKLIEKNIINAEEAMDLTKDMTKMVDERNKALTGDLAKKISDVKVKSKVKAIEFSGTHYFGYTSASPKLTSSTVGKSAGFELRRNYIQAKAYINDKDYFRVTFDGGKELGADENNMKYVTAETASDTSSQSNGYAFAYVKYAYLWLDNILPYTGAEIGIAHRPWIDYEEHNGWYYRSFNKVALEHKNTTTEYGPDLVNSADLGVNFKTKTNYFTSEIGIYNGEGYHADKRAANQKNSAKLSAEWRLTVHPFGDGDKVGKYDRTKDSYFHISTYGLNSKNHKDDNETIGDTSEYNRKIYGIHTVYNNPMFLIAGQYFKAQDDLYKVTNSTSTNKKEIDGYSINAEIRPLKDWTIIARYDAHQKDETKVNGTVTTTEDAVQKIYGVAYKLNKYVTLIGSGKDVTDDKKTTTAGAEKKVYMLTTEVKW